MGVTHLNVRLVQVGDNNYILQQMWHTLRYGQNFHLFLLVLQVSRILFPESHGLQDHQAQMGN